MRKILLTGLLISAINTTVFAQSQLISFEASEGYNLGEINGQQGWEYWGSYIDPNTGMVTSSSATNGTRSVNFVSNEYMENGGLLKSVTGYNNTQYSFDFKIDGLNGSDYTMVVWDGLTSTASPLGAFRVNYTLGNVRILEDGVGLVQTNLNLTPGTWYNFKMVINLTNKTVEYFVNNISYGTKAVATTASSFSVIDFYYDDWGSGFAIDNIKIENAATLGVKDFAVNDNFSVSPNPTVDFVNIKTDARINSVDIIDFSGKIVLTDASGEDKVNMTSLPAGGYLLKVNTSKGVLQKKIIKK